MENAEWMSADVRQEIEDLRRTYGFEEQEAIAFWHLSEARKVIMALAVANRERLEGIRERRYDAEGIEGYARFGRRLGAASEHGQMVETRITQHFEALFGLLGNRVLRRNFPEGWGRAYRDAGEEEG